MLNLSDIKTGANIVFDGEPFVVLYHEHSKTGRAGAVLRTKLRNLLTGNALEKTFQGSDKVEHADIDRSPAQYLYADNESSTFMDMESFDQFTITKEALGDKSNYLIEGTEVTVLTWNGNPVNIELPIKITLEVTEAPPNIKGDTSSGGDKVVTTETGLRITTPLHVEAGDKIIINTERNEYVSKA